MPLDPSIALRVNPIEVPDQGNLLLKAMQIKALQQHLADSDVQSQTRQNALTRALGLQQITASNPNASRTDLARAYRGGGYGAEALALEDKDADITKSLASADSSRAQAGNYASEVRQRDLQVKGGITSALAQKPNLNYGDVQILKQRLAQTGVDTSDFDTIPPTATPEQLRGFFQQYGQGAMTAAQQAEQATRQQQVQEAGRHNLSTERLTASGQAVTMRGQNMADARQAQTNSINKDAARTQVVETQNGTMLVDKGTGEVRPAMMNGRPFMGDANKLTNEQQKQITGIDSLSTAIDEYKKQLANFGIGDVLNTTQRAAMGTKYNNMMLQAKEAYNLGVLNGNDYQILTSIVTDPASGKGVFTSNAALKNQATELDRLMQNTRAAVKNKGRGDSSPMPAVGGAKFLGFESP